MGDYMVECGFTFTSALLDRINKNSTKTINLIGEIALFIILVGAIVMFVVDNIIIGIIALAIFALLLTSFILGNKSIARTNRGLLNQQVKINFNEENMTMQGYINGKQLYSTTFEYSGIKKVEIKQDLIYVYFDKKSAVVVPMASFKSNSDCEKAIELVSNNYVV